MNRTMAAPWHSLAWRLAPLLAALVLAACGGNSTEVIQSGGGLNGDPTVQEVVLDQPTGDNTTEVVVDEGPVEAFALGVTNVPYVTVVVCQPGSDTACVTIDHVLLDTGSVGLRLLRSAVTGLALPAVELPADPGRGLPAGPAVECYPFVLGGLWGPVLTADVRLGGKRAPAIPIQVIDDGASPRYAAPQDCIDAADGTLLSSITSLQAKGVLGIGMIGYDCGLACDQPSADGGFIQYYACPNGTCSPGRAPAALQLQNPIVHFETDNNGSLILLPALPELGAARVRGRLVLGIGTQSNNQLPAQPRFAFANTDTTDAAYLYVTTRMEGRDFPFSYIDSGSNGIFFDDATLPRTCAAATGTVSPWFCPSTVLRRTATLQDATGGTADVSFSIGNADVLFSTSNVGFANLGGTAGQDAGSFVWGLPFFFGRPVYTAIWGQDLALQGPWWAF